MHTHMCYTLICMLLAILCAHPVVHPYLPVALHVSAAVRSWQAEEESAGGNKQCHWESFLVLQLFA